MVQNLNEFSAKSKQTLAPASRKCQGVHADEKQTCNQTPSGAEEPHGEADGEYAVADDSLVKEKAQSCYAQACKRFAEAGFHDFGCMDVLNSGKSGELNQRQRMYAAFAQMDCPLNLEMWRLTISMLQALAPATLS